MTLTADAAFIHKYEKRRPSPRIGRQIDYRYIFDRSFSLVWASKKKLDYTHTRGNSKISIEIIKPAFKV